MTKTCLEFSKELFNGFVFRTFEFGICLGLPWRDVARPQCGRCSISQLKFRSAFLESQVWARDLDIRISNFEVPIESCILPHKLDLNPP